MGQLNSWTPRAWSPPTPLIDEGTDEGATVRFPSLAMLNGTLVVAGNALESQANAVVVSPSLVTLEEKRGSIGRPAGTFTFSFPRIASDRHDNLHVVWGEPESSRVGETTGILRKIRSLWTATSDLKTRTWSMPTRLFESAMFALIWVPRGDALRTDDTGTL